MTKLRPAALCRFQVLAAGLLALQSLLGGCFYATYPVPESPVTIFVGETIEISTGIVVGDFSETQLESTSPAVSADRFMGNHGRNWHFRILGVSPGFARVSIIATDYTSGILEFPEFSVERYVDVTVVETAADSDQDGVSDESDNCASIANPDQLDRDGDGVADACDACPDNPLKSSPGRCGCERAETDCPECPDGDADSDGVCDSLDQCPNANDQLDSDADGTPDCLDQCPNDPAKIAPGTCGCGVADADGNNDGHIDCIDTDHDGVPDETDNCPTSANTSQADADGDRMGDVCDNCPNLSNPDQADSDGNGIGDECDDPGQTQFIEVTVRVLSGGTPAPNGGVTIGSNPCPPTFPAFCEGPTNPTTGDFVCGVLADEGFRICVYGFCCGGLSRPAQNFTVTDSDGDGRMLIVIDVIAP